MTARSLVLLATWARAEWCAVQIANVFGDAPLSVEWRLDAAPDVVAAAAAAVVDELPASAWPAAVEAAVRSTMAAHRANGCAGSPAPRCVFDAVADRCGGVAENLARRPTRRRISRRPSPWPARTATSRAAAASAAPTPPSPLRPGAHAEAQLAVAVDRFGAALRGFDAVVCARTDVLWADPSFRLASLAPSRDGVHARYDLYHYARGATFERVFATARAFADRGAARGGGGGFLPFDAAAARASDLSTVRWWWLSLPRAAFDAYPATLAELKAALGARGGAVDTAPLGAPVVEGCDISVRPGTTGFDHNEAWLVHLVLAAKAPLCAAAGADISRLAFNRHAFAFGAGDDGVLEVAPT
ncbi:phytanoyl-CoA dioxygenase [Aureococcus anophagefferens]|nr:phytanoyl-CoA dioxygenase [Aureococcus anophagefferens]